MTSQHISEQKLELLVLGQEMVEGTRAEVEKHLKECQGCRSLMREMQRFYRDVDEELKNGKLASLAAAEAAARAGDGTRSLSLRKSSSPVARAGDESLVNLYSSQSGLSPARPMGMLQRVRSYALRHPVRAGAGALSGIGLIAAGVMLAGSLTRENPSFVHLNVGQAMIEVRSASNKLLWTLPSRDLAAVTSEESCHGTSHTVVGDLDGKGRNEVLVALRLEEWRGGDPAPLRVYGAGGSLHWEKELGAPVDFRGRHYPERCMVQGILLNEAVNGAGKEILAIISGGRSPGAIVRLSSSGEVLGEYWHYGSIYAFKLLDLNGDGNNELIICGTNDLPDLRGSGGRSTGEAVVLDPHRIIGRTEALSAHGFGLSPSEAEVAVIELPRSDVDDARGVPVAAFNMVLEGDGTLTIYQGPSPDQVIAFNFSKTLEPLAVAPDEHIEKLHEQLKQQGSVSSEWGESYREALKQKVRVTWRDKVTALQGSSR